MPGPVASSYFRKSSPSRTRQGLMVWLSLPDARVWRSSEKATDPTRSAGPPAIQMMPGRSPRVAWLDPHSSVAGAAGRFRFRPASMGPMSLGGDSGGTPLPAGLRGGRGGRNPQWSDDGGVSRSVEKVCHNPSPPGRRGAQRVFEANYLLYKRNCHILTADG